MTLSTLNAIFEIGEAGTIHHASSTGDRVSFTIRRNRDGLDTRLAPKDEFLLQIDEQSSTYHVVLSKKEGQRFRGIASTRELITAIGESADEGPRFTDAEILFYKEQAAKGQFTHVECLRQMIDMDGRIGCPVCAQSTGHMTGCPREVITHKPGEKSFRKLMDDYENTKDISALHASLVLDARSRGIPVDAAETLVDYVVHGTHPGGFFDAFLSNDLAKTLERADLRMAAVLPAIGKFLFNMTPGGCYGSWEKFADWGGIVRGKKR